MHNMCEEVEGLDRGGKIETKMWLQTTSSKTRNDMQSQIWLYREKIYKQGWDNTC